MVVEIHTIKPLDKEMLVEATKETKAIVTIEEHNIYGGLGSVVAELLVKYQPVPMEIVGVSDTFAESGS